MPQVAAELTPSDAPTVAGAIVAAYGDLRGHAPPARTSWLWPLALSANETDTWGNGPSPYGGLWNNNVGNVTSPHPTSEAWYDNPHVYKSLGLKFRAFDTLRAGALAMLEDLDAHGAIAAADAGDAAGWQSALTDYLHEVEKDPATGQPTGKLVPYPALDARIATLAGTSPSGAGDTPAGRLASRGRSPARVFGLVLGFVGAVGLAHMARRRVA